MPELQPQLSQEQVTRLNKFYDEFLLDEISWDDAADEMSEHIAKLAREEDVKLSVQVISKWIQNRQIEKEKKKNSQAREGQSVQNKEKTVDTILAEVVGEAGPVLVPQKMKLLMLAIPHHHPSLI